jgi:hypothetical protein
MEMVNLSNERPAIFRFYGRLIARAHLGGSLQWSAAAAREHGPDPSLAAFGINGQTGASVHDAGSSQAPATLHDSMSCSVMKAHK